MPDLLFVHGINVRGEAWFRSFELISQKVARFLPGVKAHGCQWGDAFGARLHLGGATIPGYDKTGDALPGDEDASRSRWFLLAADPLLELRIMPEEGYLGTIPGVAIFELIAKLSGDETILAILRPWFAAQLWDALITGIQASDEWKLVVESITATPAAASDKVARAVTAAYQQRLRENGYPSLSATQRNRLKDALIPLLGGPPFGVGDWLLGRLTRFGANRRGSLTDGTNPVVGDVVRYQARGGRSVTLSHAGRRKPSPP